VVTPFRMAMSVTSNRCQTTVEFPSCHDNSYARSILTLTSTNGYGLVETRISTIDFVQIGSEAHPASIRWVLQVLSPGVKWPGSEADHSPPTNAEVNNT
jgi:hypothetical protein